MNATLNIPETRCARLEGREIDDKVITLPEGLVGLPQLRRWLLADMARTNPLKWLQSLDRPEFRVPVAAPDLFSSRYVITPPPAASRILGPLRRRDLAVMIIATIHPGGSRITGNLAAPLIIDVDRRLGLQAVLEDGDLSLRQEIDYVLYNKALEDLESGRVHRVERMVSPPKVGLAESGGKREDLAVEK